VSNHNYFLNLLVTVIRLKGFKQCTLAKSIDSSHTTLNRFLNGNSDIYAGTLLNIFEKLDIDFVSILEEHSRNPNKKLSKEDHIARDISKVLSQLGPLQKKTLVSTIIQTIKRNKYLENETNNLITYRDNINTVITGGNNVGSRSS